jgi:hypothetical protein
MGGVAMNPNVRSARTGSRGGWKRPNERTVATYHERTHDPCVNGVRVIYYRSLRYLGRSHDRATLHVLPGTHGARYRAR